MRGRERPPYAEKFGLSPVQPKLFGRTALLTKPVGPFSGAVGRFGAVFAVPNTNTVNEKRPVGWGYGAVQAAGCAGAACGVRMCGAGFISVDRAGPGRWCANTNRCAQCPA